MSINAPAKPLPLKDYKSDLHNDWCPGCVTPDTRIVMGDGTSRPISEVRAGDSVLAHDGEAHRVTQVMSHWHPDTLLRLTIKCFGSVALTTDHPVYADRRERRKRVNVSGTPEWIPAAEIAVGDYVAYPRVKTSVPVATLPLTFARRAKDTRSRPLPGAVAINDDFLRLAGYFLSEGHTHRRAIGFTFGGHEMHLARETVALAGRIFELPAQIRERMEKNSIEVEINSSYLADIFCDWFGTGAWNKTIPAPLRAMPPRAQG